MTEPTDAEIRGLAATGNGVYQDDETAIWEITDPSLMKLVHAALEKWGQPAQAAEPVAWLRNTTDPHPHAVTNLKYRSAVDAEAGFEYIPVFAAPQPVAREPLTIEKIASMDYRGTLDEHIRAVRMAEFAHGIKGGQHAQGNQ